MFAILIKYGKSTDIGIPYDILGVCVEFGISGNQGTVIGFKYDKMRILKVVINVCLCLDIDANYIIRVFVVSGAST
jgi:hypothetical protein